MSFSSASPRAQPGIALVSWGGAIQGLVQAVAWECWFQSYSVCVLLYIRLDLALLLLAWVSLACHFASLHLLFSSVKRAHLMECSDGLKVFMVTLLNGFLKSRMTV